MFQTSLFLKCHTVPTVKRIWKEFFNTDISYHVQDKPLLFQVTFWLKLFYLKISLILTGFRTCCYPEHATLLSWVFYAEGVWENVRSRKVFLSDPLPPSPPEAGHETLLWEALSLHPQERSILISETEGGQSKLTGLTSVPQSITFSSYTLVRWHFSTTVRSPSNLA